MSPFEIPGANPAGAATATARLGSRRTLWAMAGSIALVLVATGAFGLLIYLMSDRFFFMNATVSDCGSGKPVPGAVAHLHLDKGIGELDHTIATDSRGRLRVSMNELPSAWATLVVDAEGYAEWKQQFKGAPTGPIQICLARVPPLDATERQRRPQ